MQTGKEEHECETKKALLNKVKQKRAGEAAKKLLKQNYEKIGNTEEKKRNTGVLKD